MAFVDWARSQSETCFDTPGSGTVGHFLAAMPAESVNILLCGDIHALFVTRAVAETLAKAGKVKAQD